MSPQILPVHPNDAIALLTLIERVICTSITSDEALQARYMENVTKNLNEWTAHPDGSCHLKAVQGQTIVGVVLIKNFWNLCSLFVAPDCQRQGIGRSLMLAAIADCKARSNEPVIYLNAAPNAIPFYQSMGCIPRTDKTPQPDGVQPMRLLL